jgi:hypothetical protein
LSFRHCYTMFFYHWYDKLGSLSAILPRIIVSSHPPRTKTSIQAMYIWRNTEAHSCNHCWSGKARGITYSECGCVEWGMGRIANCGLCGSITFSQIHHK